ncbi:MAG: hypothetical protein DYG92_05375, partial [Leptolyngbya sp. PLA1]|nr:hypothetical protein [Leptolyngbya sp. PLA1]
ERRKRSLRDIGDKRVRFSKRVGLGIGFDERFIHRLFKQRIGEQVQRIVALVIQQRFGQHERVELQRFRWNRDVFDLNGRCAVAIEKSCF